jgi:hypothetical protein
MATIVPVSLGGTGSNNISGAIDNLGISDSAVLTSLDNVNITTVTMQGLTLNDSPGTPTVVNSNLYLSEGTRINGFPVIDSPILNNATISGADLDWITESGNAFVTTARLVFGTAYESNVVFPSPITYNGYFAVDHAHSKAFFSDGYKYNELLSANSSILPTRSFGTYEQDFDVAGGDLVLRSFMDVGGIHHQIRNITMYGAIRGANTLSVYEDVSFGDNGFRYVANDEVGDQVIIGPGGIVPDTQMQINGNLRINGNLIIIGATLTQDIAAGRVQTNLHHYASTTNTSINSLIFGVDSANTGINTVQSNLHITGSYSNSRIDTVQGNVHALGTYSNTRFSSVHTSISSNVNLVQGNLHYFATTTNASSQGLHVDLTSNINTVQNNVTAIHSGSQNFTVNKTFEQDVLVEGNFVVQGSTVTSDATNLLVQDPLIVVANNQPAPASYDAGLLVYRPSVDNMAWVWDEANDGWSAFSTTDDGTTAGSISVTGYQDVYARDVRPQRDLISPNVYVTNQPSGRVVYTTTSGQLISDADLTFDGTTLTATSVDINGGSIDGVTIGTSSVATDIRVDNLQLNGNQISSTNTDGNITLEPNGSGKVDVGSQLTADSLNVEDLTSGRVVYTGTSGELQDDPDFTFNGTTVTINTVDINGGAIDGTNIGAASQGTGNFTSLESDSLSVTNATASTSKDTGAIIITAGGLGVEGAIHAGGDIEAFNTSDSRLKKNTTPITSALDKLDTINGIEFDWDAKEAGLNYSHLGGHDVGVIAQDLQEILPEAVKERDDGYLAVDYGRVVPLLIQAIKELKAKIEEK